LTSINHLIDAAVIPPSHSRSADFAESSNSVAVPAPFGGTVSVRTLNRLRMLAAEPGDGLTVRVVSNRDVYSVGDELGISLQSSGNAACLLFVRDAEGDYAVINPNRDPYIELRRGEPAIFPAPGTGKLEVIGPPGIDELLLVCAPKPAPLDAIAAHPLEAHAALSVHRYLIVEAER
jgi:hypothetical protein